MSVETHFENIQEEIVNKLQQAEKQILVAVAWLTNQRLFDILCIQADNYIDVQVLIINDEINLQSGIDYEKLIKAGGKLYWQENTSQSLMHHKFCIIDKKTVITGSYNWTGKAGQIDPPTAGAN
jgi:phosphatidylserine/phosphatidylglycerophosphate/cardiolipin synthase-like enzyme